MIKALISTAKIQGCQDAKAMHKSPPSSSAKAHDFETDFAALHDQIIDSLLLERSLGTDCEQEWMSDSETTCSTAASESSASSRFDHDNQVTSCTCDPSYRAASDGKRHRRRRSKGSQTRSINKVPSTLGVSEKKLLAMLHPQCRLQQDQKAGDPLGSNIRVQGRDACMLKLREKIQLLHRGGPVIIKGDTVSSGPGKIKRKRAKVSRESDSLVETRSVLEIKLGFLSMMYGVLLQWDKVYTGQVTFVVLRKACNDAFYRVEAVPRALKAQVPDTAPKPQVPQLQQQVDVVGTDFIVQHEEDTEVSLLSAMESAQPQKHVDPACLAVSVLYMEGLPRSRTAWIVQVVCGGRVEEASLRYDRKQSIFRSKTVRPLHFDTPSPASASLEVKLFEACRGRKIRSKVTVPLASLQDDSVGSTRLRIPVTGEKEAAIFLTLERAASTAL